MRQQRAKREWLEAVRAMRQHKWKKPLQQHAAGAFSGK
jgi:hypothetical protein